jgi:uncharacterized lipoprotein YajG
LEGKMARALIALVLGALLLSGCAAFQKELNKAVPDPALKDEPVAQVGQVMQNVAKDPVAQAVANSVPYGNIALGAVAGLGSLLTGVRLHKAHKARKARKAAAIPAGPAPAG